MISQEHGEGGDPAKVHRDVAKCIAAINALENMTIRLKVNGTFVTGKLVMSEGGCVLAGE